MQGDERVSKKPKKQPTSKRYVKVLGRRKQPIRGLWKRGKAFYARLNCPDQKGVKMTRWVKLEAVTAAEAVAKLEQIKTDNRRGELRVVGQGPTLKKYIDETYIPHLKASGKRPRTIETENGHLNRWKRQLGSKRIHKIEPSDIRSVLDNMVTVDGLNPRTSNVAWVVLRSILKLAKSDGLIRRVPDREDVPWKKVEVEPRPFFTQEEIEGIATLGREHSKNGQQLTDYLRFLARTGAREKEALRVRWEDVNLDGLQVTIGADGKTNNRKPRTVNINPELKSLLTDMKQRKAPDSEWLFPSPQRGKKDIPAKTFRESMKKAKAKHESSKIRSFGFHDCRHHFISVAVMNGIDYMTIAKWVGHRDGGLLIGKVYGHLADEHSERQAQRMDFNVSKSKKDKS